MEKKLNHELVSCDITISAKEYKEIEHAFDYLNDHKENAPTSAINECVDVLMTFLANLLDRNCNKTSGRKVQASDKQQQKEEKGCCAVVLKMAKESDVTILKTVKSIISTFTPYVERWDKILNKLVISKEHETIIAKCMPIPFAQTLQSSLNEIEGVTIVINKIQ